MADLNKMKEQSSPNLQESAVRELKNLFPEVIDESGEIDLQKLAFTLGIADEDPIVEKYEFTWPGKRAAFKLAQSPITDTLIPIRNKSVDWDETNNLYLEGDNLKVLKVLQKAYADSVKMIYLDPPYNTGKDFVYKDSFQKRTGDYLNESKQVDEDGQLLSTNAEAGGRFHSDWLNMMYPRLKVARNLLAEDGIIFISIDDNEVDNLRKVMDEVFGESNFLGNAARVTKKSNNKGDFWAPNFDYVLTYAKNIEVAEPFFGGVNYDAYNQVDETGPRAGEKYQLVRLYMSSIHNQNPDQRFWIEAPDGEKLIPAGTTFPPERPKLTDGIWRWSKKTYEENLDKIVIKQVKSSNLLNQNHEPAHWNVFTKTYLNDVINNASAKPNSLIEGHINQNGSKDLNDLKIPFDYAKPVSLLTYLMELVELKMGILF